MKKNKHSLLFKISVAISIMLHIFAIISINKVKIKSYLANKNIIFSKKTSAIASTKNKQIVNVTFKQKNNLSSKKENFSLLVKHEKNRPFNNQFNILKTEKEDHNFEIAFDNKNETYALIHKEYELPLLEKVKNDFFIPLVNIIIAFDKQTSMACLPKHEKEKHLNLTLKKRLKDPVKPIFAFKDLKNDDSLINNYNHLKAKKIKVFPHNFSLIDISQLNNLSTLSYKDFFDIDVSFAPQQTKPGYIFAITLIPKDNIKLNRLKQNIFFLLDKSNTIQKERLTSTRHAITSALSLLEKEDSFNILAFDHKLDVLSNNNLNIDQISVSRAKGFLRKQSIGSFFSSTNFSIPLFKILNKNVKDDEVNIAILLSNGDGLNKIKNSKTINQWSHLNNGNLSLFTIGLSEDKNLSILELFSFLNKGKLLSSNTNRGIKRKLNRLIKSINFPIAKNITTNAICLNKKANIKIYPPANQSPHLYLKEPYVILGTIDKLQDFTIFVQGKCKDNVFNLKKHINFDTAKQGGQVLQKELAIKEASICYDKFLTENNPKYLKKANNYLENFEIQPIFQ